MNWNDLPYVLAVHRCRTLAGAARELRVDHTTVGRRLLAIEDELGTRLFDRTPNGYEPTAAGDVVVARASQIETHAIAIEREVVGLDERAEGGVRLSGLDALIDYFLAPRLGAFHDRFPDVVVEFSSDIRTVDLSRREADVAIRGKPKDPYLVGRKLGVIASGLYATPEYVEAIGTTGTHRFIASVPHFDGSAPMKAITKHFPDATIAARGGTEGHMLECARAGLGVALVDCFAGDSIPDLRRVVPEPVLMSETWAVVHIDMHKTARVRAVLDWITEAFHENATLLEGRVPRPSTGSG